MLYQLFNKCPNQSLVEQVLRAIGLQSMSDKRPFTKRDIDYHHAIKAINSSGIIKQLRQIYIPCKAETYLTDLTNSKLITVVRQLLRAHDHKLTSKTRKIDGKRLQEYQIA